MGRVLCNDGWAVVCSRATTFALTLGHDKARLTYSPSLSSEPHWAPHAVSSFPMQHRLSQPQPSSSHHCTSWSSFSHLHQLTSLLLSPLPSAAVNQPKSLWLPRHHGIECPCPGFALLLKTLQTCFVSLATTPFHYSPCVSHQSH